jgi:hypothetical protein
MIRYLRRGVCGEDAACYGDEGRAKKEPWMELAKFSYYLEASLSVYITSCWALNDGKRKGKKNDIPNPPEIILIVKFLNTKGINRIPLASGVLSLMTWNHIGM